LYNLFLFHSLFWLCWRCPGIVYQIPYSAQATQLAKVFKRISSLRNIYPCVLKMYLLCTTQRHTYFPINGNVESISTLHIIGVASVFLFLIFSYLSFFSSCLTPLQYTNYSGWFVNNIFVVHYFSICSINYLIKFVYVGLLHTMT
jgi:hypothetical protein